MNLTRDVIMDLLPLYLAGEASADTRTLLEEYLREHPDFAATVRETAARSAALLGSGATSAPSFDRERATLEQVRRFNRRRTMLLALTWAFALTLLAFGFEGRQIRWVLLRDSPGQALILMIAAFVSLASYLAMGRKLRRSGR
jgi:anti-sigma factor RsiW